MGKAARRRINVVGTVEGLYDGLDFTVSEAVSG